MQEQGSGVPVLAMPDGSSGMQLNAAMLKQKQRG